MVIDSAGKVGIGTISPIGKLTINGNLNQNQGSLTFFSDVSGDIVYDGGNDGVFTFNNTAENGRTAFVNSNVGIGTINPTHKLTVAGRIRSESFPTNDNTPDIGSSFVLSNRGAGGTEYAWNIYTAAIGGGQGVQPNAFEIWEYPSAGVGNNTSRPRLRILSSQNESGSPVQTIIDSRGYVGIGKSPTEKLSVDGNICATGNITGNMTQCSSKEYKENFADLSLQEAIAALENMNPVKFTYKADAQKDLHVGFIAEDVPELVATSDRKGISPMDVVAVLTKVMQEQQKTIAELQSRVKSLEERRR
jgi:hypothetical protein